MYLSTIGNALCYGLAGWMLGDGVKDVYRMQQDKKLIESYPHDTPEHLQRFIRAVLKREGFQQSEQIPIIICNSPIKFAMSPYVFILNHEEASLIDLSLRTLENNKPFVTTCDLGLETTIQTVWEPYDYLKRTMGIISHEAAHGKNNDSARLIAGKMLISIAGLCALRCNGIRQITHQSLFTKIGAGYALYETDKLMHAAHARLCENWADDAITQEYEALMVIKDLLRSSHENVPSTSIYQQLLANHPVPEKRVERIWNRLQSMKNGTNPANSQIQDR